MTILGFYLAVKTRLTGMPHTPVFEVEGTGARYAQLFPTAGHVNLDRLTQEIGMLSWPFMIMCVGATPQMALDVLDLVDGRLINWWPEPGNLATSRVERDETNPPLLPAERVASDFRYSITPTYKIITDR